MAYLSRSEVMAIGFRRVGQDVRISDRAVFYHPGMMEIGDHVRIDDFCMLSHRVTLGNHVFLAAYVTLLSDSESEIVMDDFSTMAWKGTVFTESDDYKGGFLTNPTVPMKYRHCTRGSVRIGRHAIIGCGSMIFPGAHLAEGSAVGAMALVTRPTRPWTIYAGVPARAVSARKQDLLERERQLLAEEMPTESFAEMGQNGEEKR